MGRGTAISARYINMLLKVTLVADYRLQQSGANIRTDNSVD